MKQFAKKVLPFLIGAVTITMVMVSCKSGSDTNKEKVDSIQAKITEDSLKLIKEGNVKKDMVAEGVAKPNPAKKNGKGMIVFQSDFDKYYDTHYGPLAIEMDKEGIYTHTEIRPSFPGGQKALAKFIQDNILYPEAAINDGVEGSVDVNFAIDESGKLYNPMIKGDLAGYGLDQASLDVVNKMPRWNPGQIKGKNVKSYYTLPITFKIN